jgi:aryl-alcohol dehydrogenase-like predicted oxidoreductase
MIAREDQSSAIPKRPLGQTGCTVTQFALGGEGVLRTHGRMKEAVAVIHRALEQGVNYCDSAPAYAGCLDYYGEALGERRKDVFFASKTHDRTRDGSLRLLDETLRRLRSDYLDLWQLHDLRTQADLDRIFGTRGSMEALLQAREERRVRFLGITGHHDPQILLDAMQRFDFDTLLIALNAADVHRLSFVRSVLPEATRRKMGVIAMKVYAQGALLGRRRGVPLVSRTGLSADQALGYALSLPGVSTAVIGCSTPAEVDENVGIAERFRPFDESAMRQLEEQTATAASQFTSYKRPA